MTWIYEFEGPSVIAVPPFSPLDVAGCVAWFDMQDAASYSESGGLISSITNKVSSVAWTEATNRPAYAATGLNGFPCLDFDGTNDRIMSTEAAVIAAFTNTPAYTVFYVAHHDATAANHAIFGFGNSGGTTSSGWFGQRSTTKWTSGLANSAGTSINVDSAGASNTNVNVFEFFHSGTAVSLQVNGGAADPNATSQDAATVSPNRVALGCRPNSTIDLFMNGQIGEVLIYTSALNSTDRSTIRQYLGTKWGVTVTP